MGEKEKGRMTVKQAIEELEDHGVPQIIALLKFLTSEIETKDKIIKRLDAQVEVLKYGGI